MEVSDVAEDNPPTEVSLDDSLGISDEVSDDEVAAIIIYNIHNLTTDFTPSIRVREYIDAFLANTDETLVINTEMSKNNQNGNNNSFLSNIQEVNK